MFASIIFVIDIQEYYTQPILRLLDFFIAAFQENPDVNLEVFVHKAEAMTEEYRMGEQLSYCPTFIPTNAIMTR